MCDHVRCLFSSRNECITGRAEVTNHVRMKCASSAVYLEGKAGRLQSCIGFSGTTAASSLLCVHLINLHRDLRCNIFGTRVTCSKKLDTTIGVRLRYRHSQLPNSRNERTISFAEMANRVRMKCRIQLRSIA